MISTRRRAATLVFVLFAVIFVGVAGALVFLNSESGSGFILGRAKRAIEAEPGSQFTYGEAQIHILSGIHLRDLHLVHVSKGVKAEVDLPKFDLDYRIGFLSRSLEVSGFLVDRPRIRLKLEAEMSQPPPQPTPPPKQAGNSMSLENWITSPPVRIRLQAMQIHQLDLEVEQITPEQAMTVTLRGFDFGASLALEPNRLEISGVTAMAEPAQLTMKSAQSKQSLAGRLSISGKWNGSVFRGPKLWQYELKPSDFAAALNNFSMTDAEAGQTLLSSLQFKSQSRLQAESSELAREINLTSLSVDAGLDLRGFKKVGQGAAPVVIREQSLEAHGDLQSNVAFNLKYQALGLSGLGFGRPVNLSLVSHGTAERDLAHAQFKSVLALDDHTLIRLNQSVELIKGQIKAIGDLDLHLTAQALAPVPQAVTTLTKTGPVKLSLKFDVLREEKGNVDAKLKMLIPEFKWPSIGKGIIPSRMDVDGRIGWKNLDRHVDFEGDIGFNNLDLGGWKLRSQFAVDLADAEKKRPLETSGKTTVEQLKPVPAKFKTTLSRELSLEHHVRLAAHGAADVSFVVDLPELKIQGLGTLDSTHASLTAKSPNMSEARELEFTVDAKEGAIHLEQSRAVSGLSVQVRGSIHDQATFEVPQIHVDVAGGLLTLTGDASGNIKTQNLQSHIALAINVPKDFPPVAGQQMSGALSFPIGLSVYHGRDIAVNGDVALDNFSWRKNQIAMSEISGKVPVSEHLIWNGKTASFASLIKQNPFERVDFERVRPLLNGREPLKIGKIFWEEKTYGPFEGFFSLAQNIFYVHEFDLDLGAGHLSGELFLDAQPRNVQFGLLSRLTALDLAQFLPARYLKKIPGGQKDISARSGFVFNLHRSSISGRIDVTELGATQLQSMINVLDPEYQDVKMNKVRKLLQVGYPTSLGLSFAEGFMDMKIGLSVLGVQQDENIREIPIAPLLSGATGELIKTTERGPLQ